MKQVCWHSRRSKAYRGLPEARMDKARLTVEETRIYMIVDVNMWQAPPPRLLAMPHLLPQLRQRIVDELGLLYPDIHLAKFARNPRVLHGFCAAYSV